MARVERGQFRSVGGGRGMEQERIGEVGEVSGKLTKGMFSYLQLSVFSTVLWLVFHI